MPEFLNTKEFRITKSGKSAYRHINVAIKVIGNFPLKRNHFISVSQWKARNFVLFAARNRTFKLQLMEHLLTETLLAGRIRLKFDAIRLPGDPFCRFSAGIVSKNLWNLCWKLRKRLNEYIHAIVEIHFMTPMACIIACIDYYKNVEYCQLFLFIK